MTDTLGRFGFELRLHQTVASASQALDFDQFACLQDFYAMVVQHLERMNEAGISPVQPVAFEAMLEAKCWESAALFV